ncbi:CHASE3 domain-containing protein [Indioceanicola profundi]|uniref:CHASE3 domain-containing protein n=1 Tax=Indioceanicola profundi TaxID=2220096 RepID=UPI000E6AA43E|nr:CHASE3 domain-containing protein [Indioceanicola profundi]
MRFFSELTISRKLSAAFAVLIVLMLGVGAVTYSRLSFIQSTTASGKHTALVLDAVKDVLAAMVDKETGLRGFTITIDDAFLAPYNSGRNAYLEALGRAKRLTADNPEQQRRVDALNGAAEEWVAYASDQIVLLRQPGGPEQVRTAAKAGGGRWIPSVAWPTKSLMPRKA